MNFLSIWCSRRKLCRRSCRWAGPPSGRRCSASPRRVARDQLAVDLRETFQVRCVLEEDALDLLMTSGLYRETGRWMGSMDSEMNDAGGTLFSFIATDQSLHTVLFRVLGNTMLQTFWHTVIEEMIRLGMLAMDEKRYDDVPAEHGQFVEVVEKCRRKAVWKAFREHLEITENILLRKLDRRSRECGDAR